MIFTRLLLITSVLLITSGCVGTKLTVEQQYSRSDGDVFAYDIVDQASVSEEGMSIFKTRLDAKLQQLEMIGEDTNKTVEITFNHYYMRHGAARALAGIFAGADNITSTVVVKNKQTGEIEGKLKVVSKNPTATSSARSLIQQHADKIVIYLKSGKI